MKYRIVKMMTITLNHGISPNPAELYLSKGDTLLKWNCTSKRHRSNFPTCEANVDRTPVIF